MVHFTLIVSEVMMHTITHSTGRATYRFPVQWVWASDLSMILLSGLASFWAVDWTGVGTKVAAFCSVVLMFGITAAKGVDTYLIDRRNRFDAARKVLYVAQVESLTEENKDLKNQNKLLAEQNKILLDGLREEKSGFDRLRGEYSKALERLRVSTDNNIDNQERLSKMEKDLGAARSRIELLEKKP